MKADRFDQLTILELELVIEAVDVQIPLLTNGLPKYEKAERRESAQNEIDVLSRFREEMGVSLARKRTNLEYEKRSVKRAYGIYPYNNESERYW